MLSPVLQIRSCTYSAFLWCWQLQDHDSLGVKCKEAYSIIQVVNVKNSGIFRTLKFGVQLYILMINLRRTTSMFEIPPRTHFSSFWPSMLPPQIAAPWYLNAPLLTSKSKYNLFILKFHLNWIACVSLLLSYIMLWCMYVYCMCMPPVSHHLYIYYNMMVIADYYK